MCTASRGSSQVASRCGRVSAWVAAAAVPPPGRHFRPGGWLASSPGQGRSSRLLSVAWKSQPGAGCGATPLRTCVVSAIGVRLHQHSPVRFRARVVSWQGEWGRPQGVPHLMVAVLHAWAHLRAAVDVVATCKHAWKWQRCICIMVAVTTRLEPLTASTLNCRRFILHRDEANPRLKEVGAPHAENNRGQVRSGGGGGAGARAEGYSGTA